MVAGFEGLKTDFLILIMSGENLHELVLNDFIRTVFTLFTNSYSVHLKKTRLTDHNLPVDQNVIIILASPLCTDPHWKDHGFDRYNLSYEPYTNVAHLINDLDFENSRKIGDEASFVTEYPDAEVRLHNHQSGSASDNVDGDCIANFESTALTLNARTIRTLTHPGMFAILISCVVKMARTDV